MWHTISLSAGSHTWTRIRAPEPSVPKARIQCSSLSAQSMITCPASSAASSLRIATSARPSEITPGRTLGCSCAIDARALTRPLPEVPFAPLVPASCSSSCSLRLIPWQSSAFRRHAGPQLACVDCSLIPHFRRAGAMYRDSYVWELPGCSRCRITPLCQSLIRFAQPRILLGRLLRVCSSFRRVSHPRKVSPDFSRYELGVLGQPSYHWFNKPAVGCGGWSRTGLASVPHESCTGQWVRKLSWASTIV